MVYYNLENINLNKLLEKKSVMRLEKNRKNISSRVIYPGKWKRAPISIPSGLAKNRSINSKEY